MSKDARYASLVALPHFGVVVVHAVAHLALDIQLSYLQHAYAIPVIVVAPMLAWLMVLFGRTRGGWLLLFASLAGALAFAGYHHYVLISPDHLSRVPAGAWGAVFKASAHLMTVMEVIGLGVASWALGWVGRFEQAGAAHQGS